MTNRRLLGFTLLFSTLGASTLGACQGESADAEPPGDAARVSRDALAPGAIDASEPDAAGGARDCQADAMQSCDCPGGERFDRGCLPTGEWAPCPCPPAPIQVCLPGTREPCPGGRDIEPCRPGTRLCSRAGQWAACEGAVAPTDEVCNGVDDDCDGTADDGDPGGGAPCGPDTGECTSGTEHCVEGTIVCQGVIEAARERCNGADDDCDGEIDEGNPGTGPCGTDTGMCVQGTLNCIEGELVCEGRVDRVPETCNALDDDCDGTVDNGDPGGGAACGIDTGACTPGVEHCREGVIVCDRAVNPTPERCNGLDDDCDGETDEDDPEGGGDCGTDVGECERGVEHCRRGSLECADEVAPTAETCNGLDDDCNGEADDRFACCVAGAVNPEAPLADQRVQVCPGVYQLGSPPNEIGRYEDQIAERETQHEVTLTVPFLMAATEVTQAAWDALMPTPIAYFTACGGDCPAENMTWFQAVAFCNALSTAEGLDPCYFNPNDGTVYDPTDAARYLVPTWPRGQACPGYRLPTEAEWEYAARGGDTRATYGGNLDARHLMYEQPNPVLDSRSWFGANSDVEYAGCWDGTDFGGPPCGGTHPVGLKLPNPWGLYDMLGNVKEWIWDWADSYPGWAQLDPQGPPVGFGRGIRGGGWPSWARVLRAANRDWWGDGPPSYGIDVGFRVVRSNTP